MTVLPLSDVRVLDFSRLLPGPYATLLLADLGAQVDKVEEPQGDPLRRMAAAHGGTSAYFHALGRNKRSIVLDLKQPEAVTAVHRLVRGYDVLVESFRPGVMERLGLSYDVLRALNPRLVYCSISGYGQTGPDRLKAGHDLGYVARAGVLGYGGSPPDAPAMPGVQVADIGGGSLFSVVGILAALHERGRTGAGRFVDVSMTEGALAFLHMHLASRMALGSAGAPLSRGTETLNGGLPNYNVYRTRDGRGLAVAALEPKFFARFAERAGHPEWMETAFAGEGHAASTRASIAQVVGERTLAEWTQALAGLDACVEPVAEGDEVLEDPQLRARGMFLEGRDAAGNGVAHLRTPLHFGELPLRPPPGLGQHTEEILREAGLDAREISQLRARP